ncbi:MAG TPA: hypothetical protein VKA55_11560 [Gammaproteobacteria bacterium]|nr:hypothetical protein [Gammaproteobacteria bacterium]
MSAEDAGSYTDFAPPGASSGATAESRVEWVLEETLRSRRFVAAMVVGPNGWAVANRGFDHPDRMTALAPESIRLLNGLKEAFPPESAPAGRQPGEAVSFAGFGEPEAEERVPEFVAVSLGRDRKLLFRPLEVQGKTMTLVLLTRGLTANTDAVLEGIGRAVATCLATDWNKLAKS